MSKKTFLLLIILILLILGGGYYWFFVRVSFFSVNSNSGNNTSSGNGIFTSSTQPSNPGKTGMSSTTSIGSSSLILSSTSIPPLREISNVPIGGMIATTTPSSTIIRWIDRGTGHVYQAYTDNTAIEEISNTTIPMIYKSYWNTNANAFIFTSISDQSDVVTNFYTTLIPNTATSTSSSTLQSTPFSLAGLPLSSETLALAISPDLSKVGNQVLTLVDDGNGGSTGFISNFNGTQKKEIFNTPLQQINIQWPASSTIALTTKGTAFGPGFLYFVNPKTGLFTKVLGNFTGLSTLVNPDVSEVLYSYTNSAGNGITTDVYNFKTNQNQQLPFSTLADKCVWSKIQTNDLYCAIPANVPSASYPDAWYQGSVSFNDSLWEIDTVTGDLHELIDLNASSSEPIDAEDLLLSPHEDYLYFINKKDLSLWSFDLNSI